MAIVIVILQGRGEDASLVLHWEGKLLSDLTGNGECAEVDGLPILVSNPDIELDKLLAAPKLTSGTRAVMVNVQIILERTLEKYMYVEALLFNTTAFNNGIHSGCCKLIGSTSIAFRHHVMQFILATVFKAVMAGPDIQLFKRFGEQGSFIVKDGVRAFQDPRINDCKEWQGKKTSLEHKNACYDYTVSVFSNGVLRAPIRKPGAFHHA